MYYNTIDNDMKNEIITQIEEYHENASIIFDIFEKLYKENKTQDVTFLDVLEYKAKENNIYKPLPSWFMDIILVDYDSFYNYILNLGIINNGENFIMLGYDEYYCIDDIILLVEK